MDCSRGFYSALHVVAVALILTGLNAIKPACLDDPVYIEYAVEFRSHPADPYAFEFGTPVTRPANLLLVPPVIPYWLAAGISIFGDRPVLLKLWLFPFALLLTVSIWSLARRFAPKVQIPLLWLAVLSPTILPAFNLMLDVPALALGLAGLAIAMWAVERNSLPGLLLAGLLGGLAVQTKYTGAIACAAIPLWCFLQRRYLGGCLAAIAAATVVLGWEACVTHRQGDSHFLVHFGQRKGDAGMRFIHLTLPLLSQVAGLVPAVALLGFRAAGWSRSRTLLIGALIPTGILVLAAAPSHEGLIDRPGGKSVLTTSNLVYGTWILVVWTAIGLCFRLLLRLNEADPLERSKSLFLLAWLVLELLGAFALSPFPASRRVIGFACVLALMIGRLSSRTGLDPRIARVCAIAGVAYALLMFGVQLNETCAARNAAHEVVDREKQRGESGSCWYYAWHGFDYYADRNGLKPLQLNQILPKPGDRLAVLDVSDLRNVIDRQPWLVLEPLEVVETDDGFHLQSAPGYSAGATPLEHRSGPSVRILIYRVASVKPW